MLKLCPRLSITPVVKLFAFLTVALFAGSTCSLSQPTLSTSRTRVTSAAAERLLRPQWNQLFHSHAWDELDSLAEKMRGERLRFEGGGWQLHVLYCIVSAGCSNRDSDAAWEEELAALQDWIRHSPSSPTPRIALADAYERYAWKARGSGFSDTVTDEGWKLFSQRVTEARTILEECKQIGQDDPEWYNAMLEIARDQGWSRAQVEALADEAINKEPGYFYSVRDVAIYLLPKWNGEPGDTEKYVEATANRIGGSEGDALYFFVAEIVLIREYKCFSCSPPTFPWERIRKGYAAIRSLYGVNNYELNALAFLALSANDFQTARVAFAKIGEQWDPDVWDSRAQFDSGRRLPTLKLIPKGPPL
jgi:hypothetical protein